jgi:hypothetical protein
MVFCFIYAKNGRVIIVAESRKSSQIISFISKFSKMESRFRKQIDSHKFKEVGTDKLLIYIIKIQQTPVLRHVKYVEKIYTKSSGLTNVFYYTNYLQQTKYFACRNRIYSPINSKELRKNSATFLGFSTANQNQVRPFRHD